LSAGERTTASKGAIDRPSDRTSGDPPTARPVLLPPNRLSRVYAGGARIDEFRGDGHDGSAGPEDWVGSVTTSFGSRTEGLSRLPDGSVLREAMASDPIGFLGAEHVARWGSNPGLLVKLLDAGERLPVHFHPGRRFAREALGLGFGKTEAWIIVSAEADAVMHVGFRHPVPVATAARWAHEQDVAEMLSAMHQVPVRAGQVYFVPAGTLHAIGAGILLVELQEPTDLSVMLEWRRLGASSGSEHLQLGWDRVLAALDLDASPLERHLVSARSTTPSGRVQELLPELAEPYFRAQRITVDGEPVRLQRSFAIIVVLDGSLSVRSDRGDHLELRRGATALIPDAAGATVLDGQATAIRCLPPAADSGAGQW
jgi:mannose-6-phosphate isomerase